MTRPCAHTLVSDTCGTAAMEFALICPVFAMLIMGSLDIGHTLYMTSVLQGALQKAARDSTLETGSATGTQTTIDNAVKSQALRLANNATVTFSRRYYKSFSKASAAQKESFTDSTSGPNANGVCNAGEPYVDANNNNVWDADGGDSGQGGARDVTIYKVTVTYPHMFPLYKMIGGSSNATVEAKTVLANQPYGAQAKYATPTVRNCP